MADVPNTSTFSFQDVTQSVYGDAAAGRNLSSAFTNATGVFDNTYKESKNQLDDFRNYKNSVPIADGSTNTSQTSLVPQMTSSNAPSCVISASSDSGSAYEAWKAFDRLSSSPNYDHCWVNAAYNGGEEWIRVQLPAAKPCNKYTIQPALGYSTADGYAPTDWIFQGSNNGTSWTDLQNVSSQTFTSLQVKTYTFTNSTSYLYYRWYLYLSNDFQQTGLDEIKLIECQYT